MMTDDDRDFSPLSPEITEYFIPKEATIPHFEFCTTLSAKDGTTAILPLHRLALTRSPFPSTKVTGLLKFAFHRLLFLSFLPYAQVLNVFFFFSCAAAYRYVTPHTSLASSGLSASSASRVAYYQVIKVSMRFAFSPRGHKRR